MDPRHFEIAILSAQNTFFDRMKMLESSGVPRNRIIDGGVFFRNSELDITKLISEGIAYGTLRNFTLSDLYRGYGTICIIHPRVYKIPNSKLAIKFGVKSYINSVIFDGEGEVNIAKYSSIAVNQRVQFSLNGPHDYRRVATLAPSILGWPAWRYNPEDLRMKQDETCKIFIGSDVWIGKECILKSTNPDKPLVVGDGAVIAADSVVVKSVPPYAIVGGNPAQIIKYRFSDKIIESLLRIKWWDWDIDKIHDNFQYFNRVEEFVEMHDKT